MRKLSTAILAFSSLALPTIGRCQTTTSTPVWFTLNAHEGDTIISTGPITLRFGQVASTCAVATSTGPCSAGSGAPSPEAWTPPQTFTAASGKPVSVIVGAAAFGNVDPLAGVYKTVQVQEQAAAQNIAINGQPVTVPALPAASAPVWFTLNAPEGNTVATTGSLTLRFGQLASTCAVATSTAPCNAGSGAPSPEAWTSPKTFGSAGTPVSVVVGAAAFGNVDPLAGVLKTVQVQEQTAAQNLTVNGQPVTVPAVSTSPTCQLVATPNSLTFPSTPVGYTSSVPASIASNCSTTITVTSAPITGAGFSTSGFVTPFSVAPGQTHPYTATFAPTVAGNATGSITFVSNATADPNLWVALTGNGAPPQQGVLSSTPAVLSFGNVTVNSKQSQTVTITNTGVIAVTVSSVAVSGATFSLGTLTTPFTLRPQQAIQGTVAFAPTTSGAAAGTLTIRSDAQNGTLSVPLTGTGLSNSNPHSVDLTWDGTGGQIAGFNVYRSTVSSGPYSRVNSTPVVPTSYTDQTVASGTTYFYAVTAVDTAGAESGYSNQITAAIPNP